MQLLLIHLYLFPYKYNHVLHFKGSPLWYSHIWFSSSSRGKGKGMKVTAVVLTDLADTDSKEEQDTATAVDNICYEKFPSKLNVSHHPAIRYRMSS